MLWFNLLNVTTNLVWFSGVGIQNLVPMDGISGSLVLALLSLCKEVLLPFPDWAYWEAVRSVRWNRSWRGIWMGLPAGKRRGTWCNMITISRKIIVLKNYTETPAPLSLFFLSVYLQVNSFALSWVLRHDSLFTADPLSHRRTTKWKPRVKIHLASI